MVALRYVLPAGIVLGGAIVMAFGSEIDLEGGAGIVSAGLAVWGMNWLYRASIEGDRVRAAEEAARDYLDVHGHWPDEAAPATRASTGAHGPANRAEPEPERDQASPNTSTPHPLARRPWPHTSGPSSRRSRG